MEIAVADWIAHHARYAPDRHALHDLTSDRRFSYREMDQRVSRAAHYLRDGLNIAPGDRVAVLSPNDSDVFEIQFACRRLGAIFLPLNWRLAGPELEYICGDAAPAALLYGTEFTDMAEHLADIVPMRASLNNGGDSDYESGLAAASSEPFPPAPLSPDDSWIILYTSGTTGRPKGAMISYRMAHYNAVDCQMTGDLVSTAKNLVILPTFHTGGLNVWANPMFQVGGANAVMRDFDPDLLLTYLSDKALGITHTLGVPTNFLMMAEAAGFADADLSHVTCLCVGGAAAPPEMIKSYRAQGVRLRAMYGMTEIGPLGLALPPEMAMAKLGSSGLPTMHTDMKITEPDGSPTPVGQVGELMIRGPSVTKGYWNKPEATADAFTDDGWFHTGDAARVDEDGFYYIVDRWKDMFISGGENVYPVEVENALYQLDGVLEAAVIGVPDPKWGEVGRAFVVLRAGANLDDTAIIDHCREHLARYKVPKQVRLIDELPHNATGKILKHLLPAD